MWADGGNGRKHRHLLCESGGSTPEVPNRVPDLANTWKGARQARRAACCLEEQPGIE